MADYRIKDLCWDMGGIVYDGCGPHDTGVSVEIAAEGEDGTVYLSCIEADGYPCFFRSDKPLFDIISNAETFDAHVDELRELNLDIEDYTDVYSDEEMEDRELFRALIYVIRAETDDANAFCSEARGRLLSELTIPLCDIEQDWLDEQEEDWDDEQEEDQDEDSDEDWDDDEEESEEEPTEEPVVIDGVKYVSVKAVHDAFIPYLKKHAWMDNTDAKTAATGFPTEGCPYLYEDDLGEVKIGGVTYYKRAHYTMLGYFLMCGYDGKDFGFYSFSRLDNYAEKLYSLDVRPEDFPVEIAGAEQKAIKEDLC